MIKLAIVPAPGVSPSFPLLLYLQTSHITQSSSSSRFDSIRERETRLLDPLDSLQLLFINDRISSHSSKRKYRKENSHAPAQLTFTLLPSPPISKNRAPKKKPPTSPISSLNILTYSPFLSLSLVQFSSPS